MTRVWFCWSTLRIGHVLRLWHQLSGQSLYYCHSLCYGHDPHSNHHEGLSEIANMWSSAPWSLLIVAMVTLERRSTAALVQHLLWNPQCRKCFPKPGGFFVRSKLTKCHFNWVGGYETDIGRCREDEDTIFHRLICVLNTLKSLITFLTLPAWFFRFLFWSPSVLKLAIFFKSVFFGFTLIFFCSLPYSFCPAVLFARISALQ